MAFTLSFSPGELFAVPIDPVFVREYAFELRLCAYLERAIDGIVARQLGGGVHRSGGRVFDIVLVEPGPEFDARTRLTPATIPAAVLESDLGPGRARYLPAGNEHFRAAIERAADIGFIERYRRNGREYIRQTARYPDWIGRVTAIENKPTLDTPGDLIEQMRHDVSLALVDEVILATSSHVTRAHLNRLPDEIGVWRVHHSERDCSVEIIRDPVSLDVAGWGIEVGEYTPLASAIRPVSPSAKARARVRLAERAYGRGWRPALPGCAHAEVTTVCGTQSLPGCTWFERIVDPANCGPACAGFAPANPPAVDANAERDARTLWVADPPGTATEQVGLSSFREE